MCTSRRTGTTAGARCTRTRATDMARRVSTASPRRARKTRFSSTSWGPAAPSRHHSGPACTGRDGSADSDSGGLARELRAEVPQASARLGVVRLLLGGGLGLTVEVPAAHTFGVGADRQLHGGLHPFLERVDGVTMLLEHNLGR